MLLKERFSVMAAQRVLGSGVLEPAERKRLLAYVAAGMRGANAEGLPSSEGVVEVEYVRPQDQLGRYAERAVPTGERFSATSMPRGVRAWLMHEHYRDVDMANSHPTLALQALERLGVECGRLRAYVEDREASLREVKDACGVSRDAAKGLFLAICFGGGTTAWAREHAVEAASVPESVAHLQAELRAAMTALLKVHPDAARAAAQQARKNPEATNPRATQFAYIMQDIERRCLDALAVAVKSEPGMEVGALIHDGLLVGVARRDGLLDVELLRSWEVAVEAATGYAVRLAVKAWDLDPTYIPAGLVLPIAAAVPQQQPLVELPASEDGGDRTVGTLELPGMPGMPKTPPQTASLSDEDERALREALKLPAASRCPTWRSIMEAPDVGDTEGSEGGSSMSTSKSTSLRLVAVGCPACLVSPKHSHGASRAHSCIMMGAHGTTATLCCYTHGSRRLRGAELATIRRTLRALMPAPAPVLAATARQIAPIDVLRERVLTHAADNRLRKSGEAIWRPVPGCRCAYAEGEQFRDFLNELLGDDPAYQLTRVQDELVKFLRNYNPAECRTIVRDRGMISFSNGVLFLDDARFEEYPGGDDLEGRIARHHIAAPYTGSTDTPCLDRILAAQVSVEVAHSLMVQMGRLLFRVGERDCWQVMAVLVGAGGTGKSLVLEVISMMFARSQVGTLSTNHELVFGMQSKLDCEVIIGRDMPQKMAAVLPQEMLQVMTTGESMSVPRKGQTALDVAWVVPVVMASNFVFDYDNSRGQTARRLVMYWFKRPVADPDPTLLGKLKGELPAIVGRVLRAYIAAVADHGSEGFWKWCPEELRQAQKRMSASMSAVSRFFSLGPDDDVAVYLVRNESAHVSLKALTAAYNDYVGELRTLDPAFKTREVMNDEAVTMAGFEVEDKIKTCMACGNKFGKAAGSRRCCPRFNRDRRTSARAVRGLELVRVDRPDAFGEEA